MRRKSDFLSSFLPSCEWHKSPKINLSVEWKASWGASDWTSIIYGISRGWHGSRGTGDQSRYRCKFGHLHRQCNALQLPHIERRAASICCHLVNRLHLRWTAHGAGGLIYEEGGEKDRGGLKRRNGANNRRNEPPLSFARIRSDRPTEGEGEKSPTVKNAAAAL